MLNSKEFALSRGIDFEKWRGKLLYLINDMHDDYFLQMPKIDKLPDDGVVDLIKMGAIDIKLNIKDLYYDCYVGSDRINIHKIEDYDEMIADLLRLSYKDFIEEHIYNKK